jgi:hypothetical protein
MICEACFEKLLVVIHQLPCLVLQITLGSSYELLVRVASILVIISFIVPGGDRNLLGHRFSPILSLPTRHFVPLSAAVVGTPPPIAARGRLPAVLYKNGPDRFLARGRPGGDVEEVLHGLWLLLAELMHQGPLYK